MMNSTLISASIATALLASAGALAEDVTVFDFSKGNDGWVAPQGPGGTSGVDPENGNPAPGFRTTFENFGITFSRDTDRNFSRDLTASEQLTISFDTKVFSITDFIGNPSVRPWVLELRSTALAQDGYPWTSVWYKLADISSATHGDWTTFTVEIADTGSTVLPEGWGGYGAEDPDTFEPELPEGLTFTDVLAEIDEVAITTYQPGFFFLMNNFDIVIDNVTFNAKSPPQGCNAADIAEPYGVLDLSDIDAFVTTFLGGCGE